jgi:uncharacterized repeat protein (TIGR03803 family)
MSIGFVFALVGWNGRCLGPAAGAWCRARDPCPGGTDGKYPGGSLVDMNGVLFGTTGIGGKDNEGTVFAVTTAGTERVIYRFSGGAYGGSVDPNDLIDVNGVLYGTTGDSGEYIAGTVFAVTTAGMERVLHSFGGY